MNSGNTADLNGVAALYLRNSWPILFALAGAGLVCGLVLLFPESPAMVVGALAFPMLVVFTLRLPSLQCITLGPRTILALLVLRPLLDLGNSRDASVSNSFLQIAYAGIFVIVLLAVGIKAMPASWLAQRPNQYLLLLVGLTILAWAIGGIRAGANGFFRTIWGLLVALLLGPLFRSREQINAFVQTIFYSSTLLLVVLAFNLQRGSYYDDVWRLGGQFGVPNALAAVTFVFFAYGLYVLGSNQNPHLKLLNLLVLALLAGTIVFTQSRTIGGLLLLSTCLWLWTQGHRKVLYMLGVPLLILATTSNLFFGWRLLSGSATNERTSEELLDLTGRAYLWAETWQSYVNVSWLHKIIGSGWGTVFANFSLSKLSEVSSVTESSFLWFLVGAGGLGLFVYCGYLACVFYDSWTDFRGALDEFERRLAVLAMLAGLAFVVEGATTDLVLSPIASGHLYAILSIFVCRRMDLGNQRQSKI